LRRRQRQPQAQADRQQRQHGVADRQQRAGQPRRVFQATELQPGAHRHQAQRQCGQAEALQHGGGGIGQAQTGQVGGEAGNGAQDQRVARQFAQHAVAAVARQRPHRGHVAQRLAPRDQQRDPGQTLRSGQPLGQRQADDRVEAKGRLRTGSVAPPIDAGQPAQRIRQQHAGANQRQPGQPQAQRRVQLQWRLQDRVEQQHREQQVVHQPLRTVPHGAPQRGPAAQHEAEQDQQEIGQQQQRIGHAHECASGLPRACPGVLGGAKP
jgi:hypothetical protein